MSPLSQPTVSYVGFRVQWLLCEIFTEMEHYGFRKGKYEIRSSFGRDACSLVTFDNSTFCPHSVFMCFVWISEQTAIISLYNINWLVFITETQCVYCAVRTGYLCIIQVSFRSLRSPATAHAVIRRTVTAGAWVRSQLSSCGICGWQIVKRTGFCPSIWNFSCHYHSAIAP